MLPQHPLVLLANLVPIAVKKDNRDVDFIHVLKSSDFEDKLDSFQTLKITLVLLAANDHTQVSKGIINECIHLIHPTP